jgi:hypothetical protein
MSLASHATADCTAKLAMGHRQQFISRRMISALECHCRRGLRSSRFRVDAQVAGHFGA